MVIPTTKNLRQAGQLMSTLELVIIMIWRPVMRIIMARMMNRRIMNLFIERLTERYKLSSNPKIDQDIA